MLPRRGRRSQNRKPDTTRNQALNGSRFEILKNNFVMESLDTAQQPLLPKTSTNLNASMTNNVKSKGKGKSMAKVSQTKEIILVSSEVIK